jgi:signal transduction histidine kinase/CheY-like chemotaxis protein
MKITQQFAFVAAAPLLLVVAAAVIVGQQLVSLSTEGTRLVDTLRQTIVLNQQLTRGNSDQLRVLQRYLGRPDDAVAERARAMGFELEREYAAYLRLDIGDRERLTVERVKGIQLESNVLTMQVHELVRAGRQAEVTGRVQRLYEQQQQIRASFDTLNDLQMARLRDVVGHSARVLRWGLALVFVTTGIVALTIGALMLLLRRRIMRPVRAILDASERVRQGDFAARARVHRADEFGELTFGFNYMAESLAESYAGLERKVEERTKELRDMQAQLVRAEKMSAVGVLVSGVAHELNNPLAAVRGFVELARMEVAVAGGPQKALRLLGDVDGQIERCRRITNDLLQFARQQEPHLEPVDANVTLDQVLRLREYEFETHNICVVREFDASNPILSADGDRLQQVFLNLINNAYDAIRYRAGGGAITARTRVDGDDIVFEILDDGPGFRDPEQAFDPFYTTKDVGEGTGLGLSVCHGIVQDHGGDIRAENWEHGARVVVRLPRGAQQQVIPLETPVNEPVVEHVTPAGATSAVRGLVVDDEPLLQTLQVEYLKKMGIEAASVATGEAAIAFLHDNQVDLVVSDIRMPGPIDGVRLYEWVAASQPSLAARFLFVSGDLAGMHKGEFFQTHAVPTVEKPFRFSEYRAAVQRVLGSQGRPS